MLILKALLISSIFFSYSFRKPVIDLPTIPYDYEFRIGAEGGDKLIKFDIKFLYEREIGLYGYGHDIDAEIISLIKLKKCYNSLHKFSSYIRNVKDFRVTSYDYIVEIMPSFYVGPGLTLNDKELFCTAYLGYKYGILDASLRVGLNNIVKDIKIQKEYKVAEKTYIVPCLRYKAINSQEDYQGKLLLKYKI